MSRDNFEQELAEQLRDETDCPYSFCADAAKEIIRLRDALKAADTLAHQTPERSHHPGCAINDGDICNCMHPHVIVTRSSHGDCVQFADYLALEGRIERLSEALEMLYDKWENGDPCYEDGDPASNFMGNAFQLSQDEENDVLALIPKIPAKKVLTRD